MKPHNGTGQCPRCARIVSIDTNRWSRHGITRGSNDYCIMSRQPVMPTGTTDHDFERRAAIVTDLACQMRDCDTRIVWDYLTAASTLELQRMMMVALAAIPVDQTLRNTFDWVCELPIAVSS
jgi:hypothetical protein